MRLKEQLTHIGEVPDGARAAAVPSGFHSWPGDGSLRAAMQAMRSARIVEWRKRKEHEFSNQRWTEECQGVTHDGQYWYLSSNNSDFRGIYKLDSGFRVLKRGSFPSRLGNHIGDIDYHQGRIYAALEPGPAVLVFDQDLRHIDTADLRGPQGRKVQSKAPWCAIHPWNGYLYSSNFDGVTRLEAYDPRQNFHHVGAFTLKGGPINRVQGGCFSSNGHVYLASDDSSNAEIRAYSTLNGALLGAQPIQRNNSWNVGEEVEGIAFQPLAFGSKQAQIHVVLLDNDATNKDDIFLKHFAGPDPEAV